MWSLHSFNKTSSNSNSNEFQLWKDSHVWFKMVCISLTHVLHSAGCYKCCFGVLPSAEWWGREMTEWQVWSSVSYGGECMLKLFASGALLSRTRGCTSLCLTQETAMSLLMHWSMCVRVSVSESVCYYLRQSSCQCEGMSNSLCVGRNVWCIICMCVWNVMLLHTLRLCLLTCPDTSDSSSSLLEVGSLEA